MGTNYYWSKEAPCPTCGHAAPREHIGKSSSGWCFSLHVTDELPDLDAWKREWASAPHGVIHDEYGRTVSVAEMLSVITDRSRPARCAFAPGFLAENHAIAGPNGLLRFSIDHTSRCVGHGEGTWDLIAGEFS